MKSWQKRVIKERDMLQRRLTKLQEYLESDISHILPNNEQLLLVRQEMYMTRYLEVLEDRIVLFNKKAP